MKTIPKKRSDCCGQTSAGLLLALALAGCLSASGGDAVPAPPARLKIGAPPAALVQALNLSTFYKKAVDASGFPVVGSDKVADAALLEAARITEKMLDGRDDIRQAIVRNKIRLAVMAQTEQTTDVPEHSDLTPKKYWDQRARGLGATSARPAVSCGEENLLHLPGDRYPNENILVHEFGHVIHEMGLNSIDSHFDAALNALYNTSVKKKGLWKGTYAAENYKEYWAEGVQSYFDTNDNNNHQHNDIDTREKLAKYDPEFFALLDSVFKSNTWRYERKSKTNPPWKPAVEVTLTIENQGATDADIYWVDNGEEKKRATLAPKQRLGQHTFEGHVFRAKRKDAAPVEFTASAQKTEWVIK
jgi:hypothetical protein